MVRSYTSVNRTRGKYDANGKSIKVSLASVELDKKLEKATQEILKQITTSSMTKSRKLEAVWRYVTSGANFSYWPKYPNLSKKGWQKETALDMLTTRKGNCYSFACAFAALASEIGYSPSIICGRVSGSRDAAADGMTRHCWVQISGLFYDPEAQFAGWYRNVYGLPTYDIYHTIQRIVSFN
jgi:hypothetical protein